MVIVDQGAAKIDTDGAAALMLNGARIEGKVSSNGDANVRVVGCTIRGKLEVLNATICKSSDNNAQGQTNTPGCWI